LERGPRRFELAAQLADSSLGNLWKTTTVFNSRFASIGLLMLSVIAMTGAAANAQVVFSNDFESNTNGFAPGGSIVSLSTTSLPTDGGGLASPNQSMWLGRLGSGVPKSGSIDEIVTLNVTGLTAGQLLFRRI
jgi:hypothetical protein